MTSSPQVSVIMPTFEQVSFLGRAVGSLLRQTRADWELIIVDDGSHDDTAAVVKPFLADPRISCQPLADNRGLGAALNVGLAAARAPLIAYLPSDDLYDPGHLGALLACFDDEVVLAWSGMRHHGDRVALGPADGLPLQLVQVMHRLSRQRWVERDELESDDLERLFWSSLRDHGRFSGSGSVTCEWVDHPGQRHKAIRESCDGGLNVFRSRYRVATPLRFHSSDSWPVDEVALYRRFRERPPTPPAADGLTILLVGELAYNPERVLALEERGHRLYGLWTPDGLGANTVGPLPFGHVTDLPRHDWRRAVRQVRPDVIYGLLNWRAVPFAHAVLDADTGVPFVWHFKESPARCLRRGTWPQLVDLCTRSDAQVYSSPEELAWFQSALPGRLDPQRCLVLDGDLPKRDWFTGQRRLTGQRRSTGHRLTGQVGARLSSRDGQLHTVALGRPLGIDPPLVGGLAAADVHLHLYGQVRAPGPKGDWLGWLDQARRLAPRHLHLHPHVDQRGWVRELSRYDAGWLHRVRSSNQGDLAAASWDDLNYPARIPPLMAAGVPLLQQRSPGCVVAAQRLVERLGIGILYDDVDDLAAQLRDDDAQRRRRRAVDAHRDEFTFDHHVDRLVDLFRTVAA
ncbi:MAG: glycosyltransferase family 2 protein [Actinomycetota bacterium]|nr:glycosyltransferase family 2 protein [Actinomycetota bacterium]